MPETGAEKEIKLDDLGQNFSGYVIYIHPRTEFTDPQAPHQSVNSQSSLVLGAFLITPIFTARFCWQRY